MKLSDKARESVRRDQERYEAMARRKGWVKPGEALGYFNRYRSARTGEIQKGRIYGSMVEAFEDRVPDSGSFFREGTYALIVREA